MQRIEVAGDSIPIPRAVEAEGRQGAYLADEFNSRGMLPFDPTQQSAEDVIDALEELSDEEVQRIHACDTRVTVREAAREILVSEED